MSIFIDSNTKLVVQGITGRDGSFHTQGMLEYGTQVVGGVTPGKTGTVGAWSRSLSRTVRTISGDR